MAKFVCVGIEEYEKKIMKLGQDGVAIIKQAVYEGGDELAGAVRESINSMDTVDDVKVLAAWRKQEKFDGLTEEQKKGLQKGLKLEKMKNENGYIYTQLKFVGYNEVVTKQYPKGQPNALIARSMESGSSARPKHPFFRPAITRHRDTAEKRMTTKVYELVNKIM